MKEYGGGSMFLNQQIVDLIWGQKPLVEGAVVDKSMKPVQCGGGEYFSKLGPHPHGQNRFIAKQLEEIGIPIQVETMQKALLYSS